MNHCNSNSCDHKPTPSCCSDFGPNPFTIDVRQAAIQNDCFRTALWSGNNLQLTLMSIPGNCDIGLEMHPYLDQFLYIEKGQGIVMMGKNKNCLDYHMPVCANCGIFVPACTWHNVVNTDGCSLKLFSVYAPPQHPKCTVHQTKKDAES